MSDEILHVCKDCKHSEVKSIEEMKLTYGVYFCKLYRNRVDGENLNCIYIRTKSDSNTCEGYDPRE